MAEFASEDQVAVCVEPTGGILLCDLRLPVSLEPVDSLCVERDRAMRAVGLARGDCHAAARRDDLLGDRQPSFFGVVPEPGEAEELRAPGTRRDRHAPERGESIVLDRVEQVMQL